MPAVTVKRISTIPNAVEITIHGETHTAASSIVERLEGMPSCEYAAYKVEHPMDDFVSIRIKSAADADPVRLFKEALGSIASDVNELMASVRD